MKELIIIILGIAAFVALTALVGIDASLNVLSKHVPGLLDALIAAAVAALIAFLKSISTKREEKPTPPPIMERPTGSARAGSIKDYVQKADQYIFLMRSRQELLRLFISSGLWVALGSCLATMAAPFSESQGRHLVLLLAAFAIAGMITGVMAGARLREVAFRHAVRLGFLAPLYVNVTSLLVTIGYTYQQLWPQRSQVFGISLSLSTLIALLRLVILPSVSLVAFMFGSRLSRAGR